MALEEILPQVAGGGTILVAGYSARMLLEYIAQRRSGKLEDKKLEMAEEARHVTDASVANAILLASLKDLRADVEKKDERIEKLEARNAEKDERIEKLQNEVRDLRSQVHALLQRLDGVDFELDDLRDNH